MLQYGHLVVQLKGVIKMNVVECIVNFDLSKPNWCETECLNCGSDSIRIFTGFFCTDGVPISFEIAIEWNMQKNLPIGAVLVSNAYCADCSAKFLALVCEKSEYYDLVWPEVVFSTA